MIIPPFTPRKFGEKPSRNLGNRGTIGGGGGGGRGGASFFLNK